MPQCTMGDEMDEEDGWLMVYSLGFGLLLEKNLVAVLVGGEPEAVVKENPSLVIFGRLALEDRPVPRPIRRRGRLAHVRFCPPEHRNHPQHNIT